MTSAARYGISTPGLTLAMGDMRHAAWERVATIFAIGGTIMNATFVHQSRAHYIKQLEALAVLKV